MVSETQTQIMTGRGAGENAENKAVDSSKGEVKGIMMFDLDLLFQKSDLIPVIIQHAETKDILMLGFTNKEAVELTMKTKTAWFWSRSRQELWNKGGTSGNFLHVKKIMTDCDTDTLLYFCIPDGPTCHTGADSCFFNEIALEL